MFKNSKTKNKDLYPAFHIDLNNNNFFPLGTKPNSLNLLCNESGRWSIFESDRYGFNNPDNVWDFDEHIILIGDSFVQGACVDQNNNISSNMIKFGKENTLNLSNSGMGPLSELALLMEHRVIINPTDIFLFYYEGNDIIDLNLEFQNEILFNYLVYGSLQYLVDPDKTSQIDKFFETNYQKQKNIKKENVFESFLKLKKSRNLIATLKNIYFPINKKDLSLFNTTIERFKFLTDQLNSNFYFVYLPSYHRYSMLDFFEIDKFSKRKILEIVKQNNIKLIDIDDIMFTKKNFKNYYPNGQFGHFNETGYYEIAKIIKDYAN